MNETRYQVPESIQNSIRASKTVTFFKGRPLADMTKEELIDAIHIMMQEKDVMFESLQAMAGLKVRGR